MQDYHSQIKSIVNSVLDDYRNLNVNEIEIQQETADLNKKETEYEEKFIDFFHSILRTLICVTFYT